MEQFISTDKLLCLKAVNEVLGDVFFFSLEHSLNVTEPKKGVGYGQSSTYHDCISEPSGAKQ